MMAWTTGTVSHPFNASRRNFGPDHDVCRLFLSAFISGYPTFIVYSYS
jgi:hypothetical protein